MFGELVDGELRGAPTETEITQTWTEVQQSDDDPISDSEALEIITGGADA